MIVLPLKMLTNQHRFLPSTRVDTMQEERLAAEEAAHVATEEAIRKAEVQTAQKAKQAGNDKRTLDKSQQAYLPSNLSVLEHLRLHGYVCFCTDWSEILSSSVDAC